MRLFCAALLVAAFSACPQKPKCDSTTCSSGCCDATGMCQPGDSASACGTGGAICSNCIASSCTTLRVCGGSTGGGGGGGMGGGSGGGGGGTTGGGGGATGGRTVTFTRTIRYVDERGMTTFTSLGDAGISLSVNNAALPGTRTESTYVVQNVPAGEYVVRFGSSFYAAQGDTLDVGFTDLGRADLQYVDAGAATFTLATAGLPAWNDSDSVLLFSHGANIYSFDGTALTSGPTAGMVPTSFTWDYGQLQGGETPRLEAAKGDTLWALYQQYQPLITTAVPGAAEDGGVADVPLECNVSIAVAHITSTTINPGPNAAAGTFASTPSQSVAITWPRTQWEARAAEAHPQATQYFETLYVFSEPAQSTASADLISCTNDTRFGNPISDVNRSVTVINALPTGWRTLGFAAANFRVSTTLLDAGVWSATGELTAESALNQPFVPQVHAPTQLRVQSIAADQLVTAAAAGPLTVSWTANATPPAATDYLVSLVRLTKPAGSIVRSTVARAFTRGTTFTFPVGTLELGGIYQLRVRARITTASAASPLDGRSTSTAEAISNPFIVQ